MKHAEFDNADCKNVETIVPINSELNYDCKIQSSMNENEKILQYFEDLDVEFLNSSSEFKETILNLNEGSAEKSSSCEGKCRLSILSLNTFIYPLGVTLTHHSHMVSLGSF